MSDSFVTPWTIAFQAPLSMGFFRQENWSVLLFPSPDDLPNLEISFFSCIAGRFLTTEPPGKPFQVYIGCVKRQYWVLISYYILKSHHICLYIAVFPQNFSHTNRTHAWFLSLVSDLIVFLSILHSLSGIFQKLLFQGHAWLSMCTTGNHLSDLILLELLTACLIVDQSLLKFYLFFPGRESFQCIMFTLFWAPVAAYSLSSVKTAFHRVNCYLSWSSLSIYTCCYVILYSLMSLNCTNMPVILNEYLTLTP